MSARPLREDATEFHHVDGHIDAKLDLEASGESAVQSTLGGVASIQFQDATIRGASLPRMVQLLTKNRCKDGTRGKQQTREPWRNLSGQRWSGDDRCASIRW